MPLNGEQMIETVISDLASPTLGGTNNTHSSKGCVLSDEDNEHSLYGTHAIASMQGLSTAHGSHTKNASKVIHSPNVVKRKMYDSVRKS